MFKIDHKSLVSKRLILFFTISVLACLFGCVQSYVPVDGSEQKIDIDVAQKNAQRMLQNNFPSFQIFITTSNVAIVNPKTNSIIADIPLRDFYIAADSCLLEISVDRKPIISFGGYYSSPVCYLDRIKYDVDTWIAMRKYAVEDSNDAIDRFEMALHSADEESKIVSKESIRRFKIQAEASVKDKQFAEAAEYYRQALAVAPGWADGYFNYALMLGEIWDFQGAILNMQHYLDLAPDASNARAAQDKIYEWERKAKATSDNNAHKIQGRYY